MKMIVDRIEGNLVVCEKEDGSFIDKELSSLPSEIKAGDVLVFKKEKWEVDRQMTIDRKKHIENMMKDIWEE